MKKLLTFICALFCALISWGQVDLSTPLTITAEEAGATVKMVTEGKLTSSLDLQYKINNGDWQSYTIGVDITLENVDDVVSFQRGSSVTFSQTISNSTSNYTHFVFNDKKVSISGNPRSLTHKSFTSAGSVSTYHFYSLFINCQNITSIESLILSATGLGTHCYHSMFEGCTQIKKIPIFNITSTTLSDYCFQAMFEGCTALVNAPELPAIELKSHCYDSMFKGCTALTTAPELPATTLASNCYQSMFEGCTALVNAPQKLPAITLASYCYQSMFEGCTSLTTAPYIAGENLDYNSDCYKNMFKNCSNLNYVKVGLKSWSGSTVSWRSTDWLSGVAETGTFICPTELELKRGVNFIPEKWDINPTFAFGKITATADENGSISVAKGESTIVLDDEHSAIISGKVPSEETSITEKLTITCTPNEDYELKSLTINNQDIPLENITDNKYDYNFTYSGSEDAPTALTISAEYKVSGTVTTKYKLTKQVTGEGGSIGLYLNTSGNEITEAEAGKTIYVVIPENVDLRKLLTLTYTPEGGAAQTITLNGNKGTFTMPDANVTVSAGFDDKTHVNSINIVNESGKVKLADNEETLQLSATVLPEGASDKTVTWSSSNDAIAEVSTEGLVTAKSAGDVTITAKSNLDSEITSTIELSVYRLPDSYTINTGDIESTNYFIGKAIDKSQITVTAHYTGGEDADITSDCEINVTAEPASALDESLKFTQSGDVTINISASYNGNAINPMQINKNIKGLSELSVDDIEMLLCDDPLTIKPKTNIVNPVFTYTLPQYGRCVSIDENGVITPISSGTNTITISFAGNDDFSPAEATFKVKVIDAEDIAVVVTAEEENATVKLAIEGTVTNLPKLHYKVNNDAHWTEYTIGKSIDLPNKGDKVQISRISSEIEGTGVYQGFSIDTENYIHFVFDKAVSVSGKISALTHKSYDNDGKFDTPYLYNSLFKGCTTLISANELSLHSGKVSESGYQSMFEGCTALKNTPELQAITIDKSSYQSMFKGCTALETTPALSATPRVSSYQSMFEGCTALKTVSQMPTSISLNTYYATSCYQSMFEGCTALTTAPTLVATTLAESCYKSMFKGCTALLGAPALPATSLKSGCYQSMFEGCTSLTTAPTLSVTTLADSCYNSMFKGCTALLVAPELPASSLNAGCYKSMFECCTSLTTAPELSAGSTAAYCYYRMFANCTSLEKAPDLPFTTIIFNYPLAEMFKGCKKLNYVSIIQLNNWGDDKTADWLEGVADEGTFKCKDALAKTRDASHIPTGWLVNPSNPNTFYANISTTAENGSISILRGEKDVEFDEQGKATISKLVDGESVTESLTITCTPKAGYELESLTIGGQEIPLADITDNTYEYEEFTYSGTKEEPSQLNIIATFIQATPTEDYSRDIVIPEGEVFAFGTICLPSYGEVTSDGTVQFFVIDHKSAPQYDIVIEGDYTPRYITLQEVEATELVNGTPYIFKATDSFSIAPSKEGVSAPVNTPENGLFGTFEGIDKLEKGTHIIYNNLIYIVNTDNVVVNPFRAYIDLTDVPTEPDQTPGVKMFNFFYNEADGIMNIYDNDNVNGNVSVNLNGQAVGVGYKGIVIMNGKKMLRR